MDEDCLLEYGGEYVEPGAVVPHAGFCAGCQVYLYRDGRKLVCMTFLG